MADHTKIEWTDATWNIITGCSVVSAGCKHCYAMKLAGTRLKHDPSREGLTIETAAGPVWNGEVRFNEHWLDQPLRWRRPRRIFVCAHGDLFHESVPDEWIDRVFAVMMLAPQHAFQVLTKRPERALEYLTTRWQPAAAQNVELPEGESLKIPAEKEGDTRRDIIVDTCYEVARSANLDRRDDFWMPDESAVHSHVAWPLPNVWLGVSVEHQEAAKARIPHLLATPAAVRWISAEPLLGPVDLLAFIDPTGACCCREMSPCTGCPVDAPWVRSGAKLDWVVAGGESGPGARPMHPDWARSLRDQCAAAGVPFLFKQWGTYAPNDNRGDRLFVYHNGMTDIPDDRWPDPDCDGETHMAPVGKKAAGRLLDGVLHDGYPEMREK